MKQRCGDLAGKENGFELRGIENQTEFHKTLLKSAKANHLLAIFAKRIQQIIISCKRF